VSPADHVQMQVIHGLAALGAGVDYKPEATIELMLARDLRCILHEFAEELGLRWAYLGQRLDMLFGQDENVGHGLGVDIANRDAYLILVDFLCGNHPRDDFAKKTSAAHGFILNQVHFRKYFGVSPAAHGL
jgi:hypothetical protein